MFLKLEENRDNPNVTVLEVLFLTIASLFGTDEYDGFLNIISSIGQLCVLCVPDSPPTGSCGWGLALLRLSL